MEQGSSTTSDTVLGVGGDVAEIVGAQTRVEGVDHRAHQRHREVQLEVLGLVPEQRRDAIAVADTQAGEPAREPPRPLGAPAELVRSIEPSPTTRHDRARFSRSARSTSVVSDSWNRPSSDRSAWLLRLSEVPRLYQRSRRGRSFDATAVGPFRQFVKTRCPTGRLLGVDRSNHAMKHRNNNRDIRAVVERGVKVAISMLWYSGAGSREAS